MSTGQRRNTHKITRKQTHQKSTSQKSPHNVTPSKQRKPQYRVKQQKTSIQEIQKQVKQHVSEKKNNSINNNNIPQTQSVMVIPTTIPVEVLQTMGNTYVAWWFWTSKVFAAVSASETFYQTTVFRGISYMLQGILTQTQSGTQVLTQMPIIFAKINKLLSTKNIRYLRGSIQYSTLWNADSFSLATVSTTPGGVFLCVETNNTSETISYTSTNYGNEDLQSYSLMVKSAPSETINDSQIIPTEKSLPRYEKDPSAFARNYAFFGNATNGNGLYSDAELEVHFNMPFCSKFVNYNTRDSVVSRVFKPTSGGISNIVGLPLTDRSFGEKNFKNPIPIIYKFIDFSELYSLVVGWLAKCATQTLLANDGTFPFPISCGYMDFAILLRQILLLQFPSQIHAQFIQPINAASASGEAVFIPLMVDSVTYPSTMFSDARLPTFILENLCMLKSYSYIPHTRKSNNPNLAVTYVPVWGVYSGDTFPIPTYLDGNGDPQPIFGQPNRYSAYNLNDLTLPGNNKINPNSNYFSILLQNWNSIIDQCKTVGGTLTVVGTDTNAAGSLLPITRVLAKSTVDFDAETYGLPLPPLQYDKYIQNPASALHQAKKKMTKIDSKAKLINAKDKDNNNNVGMIPAANLTELVTVNFLSAAGIDQTMLANYQFFITPVIRLDPDNVQDSLSLTAYQTYTGEIYNCAYNVLNSNFSEYARLMAVAGMMVVGQFAPSSENEQLVKAITEIVQQSRGASFFSDLLSGVLGAVPIVGPILSNVAKSL